MKKMAIGLQSRAGLAGLFGFHHRILGVLLLVAAMVGLSSCGPRGNEPNVEIIQDMMAQEAIKPQEYDEHFKGGISSLTPPANTQPVGFEPYKWGTDAQAASRENKNPMAGKMDPDTLMTGQKYYEIHCKVCHGLGGRGDGPIKAAYPLAIPSVVSDKVAGMTDGGLYHIITKGQGVMGAYESHVPQKYRWQLVNYVRNLRSQDSAKAKDSTK